MKRIPAQDQYDLFGERAAAEEALDAETEATRVRIEFLTAWRAQMHLDCCIGGPCPPSEYGQAQVRCGRCGEFTFAYGMIVNHDLGWCGCPRERRDAEGNYIGFGQFADADEMSANRHDSQHHMPCARPGCGHAWGIHTKGFAVLPAEECHCYGWCGCPGYIAPPKDERAVTARER